MKRNRERNGSWAEVARNGLLGCVLGGAVLGAAGGCAAMEELDAAGTEQEAVPGAVEQGLTGVTTEADDAAHRIKRYVPMAFRSPPGDASLPRTSSDSDWNTAFAVHNPSPALQTIYVTAYDGIGNTFTRNPIDLPAGGATSFMLDEGNVPTWFRGAVRLEGQDTFEVVAVQLPAQTSVENRPLTIASEITPRSLSFPTVQRNAGSRVTRIFLHNPGYIAGRGQDTLRFLFRDTTGALRCEVFRTIGRVAEYDLATSFSECPFPSAWTGTATVEIVAPDGQLVGAAMQVDTAGPRVSAYEGMRGCESPSFPAVSRGHHGASSSIALHNLGTATNSSFMRFASSDGSTRIYRPVTIQGLGREEVGTSHFTAPYAGSATYLPGVTELAALSTTTRDDGGPHYEAVSPGVCENEGAGARFSLPYVRCSTQGFANSRPTTNIAIENLASTATRVRVTYFNAHGTPATPQPQELTIAAHGKANTSPCALGLDEFGYSPFGGSAIIEGETGSDRLGVVVRAGGPTAAEEYTGIPIPRLVWPNATSFANSDPWLAVNHQAIRQMRPNVLLLNFVNGFANAADRFQEVASAYRIATRYHGRTDPSAPPFVDFQLAKLVDLTDAAPPAGWPFQNSTKFPRSSTVAPFGVVDYARFFGAAFAAHYGYPDGTGGYHDLCGLIDRGLIHELWFVASQDVPDSVPAESLESKQRYDAAGNRIPGSFDRCAGNGCFAASVPVCGRSVRIAFLNYNRGAGCFLESLGHSFEGMALNGSLPYLRPYFRELGMFDLDDSYGTPFSSWYACGSGTCLTYSGVTSTSMRVDWSIGSQSGTIDPFLPACGNAHFSPSSRGHYDLSNPQVVPSTCAHFRMKDGPGGTDLVEPYASSDLADFAALAPDCTGPWQVYWRQSFPGLDNQAKDSAGGPMRNWWPFLYY